MGSPIGQPMTHEASVDAVAFSPDGKIVLLSQTTPRVWDAAVGSPIGQPMTHEDWINAVAFSPDGKWVLTGSRDNGAALERRRLARRTADDARGLGRRRGVQPRRQDRPHRELGQHRAALERVGSPIGQPMTHEDRVNAMAFSPDSKLRKPGVLPEPPWRVNAVAFSPDGKTVLTGSTDKTARLWSTAARSPIGQPMTHRGSVNAVAFSPDGKIASGSLDNTARLWDAAAGRRSGNP